MSAPTYTYTANTPNSADPMNVTQPLILANFQAMVELVNVNHVGFNQTNTGKHNFISMPNQSTTPDTAATEIALFTQATPSGPNDCEMFFEYPNNSSTNVIAPVQLSNVQLPVATGAIGALSEATGITGSPSYNTISLGTQTSGFVQFPSGFILKWFGNGGSLYSGVITFVYGTTYFNDDTNEQLTCPVFINGPTVSMFPCSTNGVGNNQNWYATNSTQTSFVQNTISGSNTLGAQQSLSILCWGF